MKLGDLQNKGLGLNDKINFGSYRLLTVAEVIKVKPNYLHWCLQNVKGFRLSKEAARLLSDETFDTDLTDALPDITDSF